MSLSPPKIYYRKSHAPCLDCPDRHVGCHAECERYANYKAARDAEREAAHRAYMAENEAEDYAARRAERIKERKRKK